MSLLRMGWAWFCGATVLKYPPREVAIEPTNLCNFRCTYCPQSKPEHHKLPSGYMKLEHLDTILDRVVEAGAGWNGRVSLTHDGEPLLHPEFPEFVKRANQRGFKPRFSSNGLKLTPEKADLLEKAGNFTVNVDFSSDPEVFETFRGRTGHWATIKEHLSHLINMSNRNPNVQVEVFEMAGYAKPEERQVMIDRLKAVLPPATSERVEWNVRVFHNATGTVAKSAEGQRTEVKGKYRRCPYPWSSMTIAWDGEVHACCRDLEGRTRLGNILQAKSLWEVWNGEKYQQFRKLIATKHPEKLAACVGCDMPWSGDPAKWRPSSILRYLRKR